MDIDDVFVFERDREPSEDDVEVEDDQTYEEPLQNTKAIDVSRGGWGQKVV